MIFCVCEARFCREFRSGNCLRGDACWFSHGQANFQPRSSNRCLNFQRGTCSRGNACHFSHAPIEKSEKCQSFRRGVCTRGDACRFSHEEDVAELALRAERLSLQTTVFVDDEKTLALAIDALSRSRSIAFDAEGVKLSRVGALTIASFLCLDLPSPQPVYLVDIQVLGAERVFSKTLPSLRALIENPAITKVTFDCRSDSDALFHQYGVVLSGVLELQVLDQAVRLQKGEPLPSPSLYVKTGFLQSMSKVAERYLKPYQYAEKQASPHRDDPEVWSRRPLSSEAKQYAANDAFMIKDLLDAMFCVDIDKVFLNGVLDHSARYERVFRESKEQVVDQESRMTEYPIVDGNLLPKDRPVLERLTKWELVVKQLRAGQPCATLATDVMFILQHDDWYTASSRIFLKELLVAFPHFTPNQSVLLMSELSKRTQKDLAK